MKNYQDELRCSYLALKVASRCNLNCSYCYMYNKGDLTYKTMPKVMSDEVVDALLLRTFNHCRQHQVEQFIFGFHGGEPLLAGKEFYKKFVSKANALLQPAGIRPVYIMQTNALLLDDEWCAILGELDITIGISVDPSEAIHNEFRVDHSGRGSYQRTIEGFQTAMQSQALPSPPIILCVINLAANPIETYEHFKKLGARGVDFLFTFDTYDNVSQLIAEQGKGSETAFADWLIPLFDRWLEEKPGEKIEIRLFDGMIQALLGKDFPADFLGELNNEVLVIETDGGIEAIDTLKTCGHGFTKAGANVKFMEFDEAMQTKLAYLYMKSHSLLCTQCLNCPIKELCGGGYLANRYRKANGFNNPSVYCKDIIKLYAYIQNKLIDQMPDELIASSGIQRMSYALLAEYVSNPENHTELSPYAEMLESFRFEHPNPAATTVGT